jgi:hypothetical protein
MNREHWEYITLELDVSQGHKLHFLVDSGAHISFIKTYKLLGAAEFEPKDRVCVNSIEGSIIETHDSLQAWIWDRGIDISFSFQLVSQQVDRKGDGIVGSNFFKLMQAQICYKEWPLTFWHSGFVIHEFISLPEPEGREPHQGVGVGNLTFPAWTELIVQ